MSHLYLLIIVNELMKYILTNFYSLYFRYVISGTPESWEEAQSKIASDKKNISTIVSIKNSESIKKRKATETAVDVANKEFKTLKREGKKSKKYRK